MSNILQYSDAAALGVHARQITGKNKDGFGVGGYAAFIQSITGRVPTIIETSPGHIKVVLDQVQIKQMQQWLDGVVARPFQAKPATPPTVRYELGPVVKPWAVKYGLPITLGLFVSGYLLGTWMS